MYGYEPKNDPEPGSWGEILVIIRVVFGVLAKPIAGMLLVMGLVVATVMLLFSQPLLALIPIAGLGAIVWWVIRRDRQAIRDAEEGLPPPWK